MVKYNTDTENKIKAAAREVFIEMGKDGARMHIIAERANVNKALLHYYFRSKERLYIEVLADTLKEVIKRLVSIPEEKSFKEFLWEFINNHIDFIQHNKPIFAFLLWELRNNPEQIQEIIEKVKQESQVNPYEHMQKRYEKGLKNGEIKPFNLMHFILNVVSLDLFPFMAESVARFIFDISQEQYEELLKERKKVVFDMIWNFIKAS